MKKSIIIATLLTLTAFLTSFSASAQRGYRGFVDVEIGAAIAATGSADTNAIAIGISTSHGYQINNWFIGAGVDFMWTPNARLYHCNRNGYNTDGCDTSLPIYAKFRYDFSLISDKSFYAALKAGYDALYKDFFVAPSIGLRKTINNGHSLNFGLNLNIKPLNKDLEGTFIAPTVSVGYEF